MIITKMAIPRRTVLRGMGAMIALPFLDAMTPALRAASTTAASGVPRLGFFYVPNGMYLPNFHPTGNGGKSFELTPILKPLEPLREHITVLSGLSNTHVISYNEGGGVHTRAHAGWLNGVLPKRTEGTDITAAKTIDQYAADKLGEGTSLRSLELTTENNFQVGNCENGYSCAYLNSTSWRTATTPNPHERDPRVVFQRLFGDGGSVQARLAQMRKDRSILDSVTDSMSRLKKRLGVGDQMMVTDYLDAVREVERRIQKTEDTNMTRPLPSVEQPAGVPEEYDEHAKLLMDLLVLAYQGDITRVSCMQIARESSTRTYPSIGVPEGHHPVSHHQNDPYNIQQNTKINAYHVSLYARLVEKLRAIPDGDGTLLDHSIMVYGAGMGDGDHHTPYDLPVVVSGGGCGQIAGGRHLKYPLNTPFMNFGVSVLEKVGVPVASLSDSTGPLTDF
jgi:hypothetical protein